MTLTHIVDGDNEDRLALLQQVLQLVEVFLLVALDPHFFLFAEDRLFKVQGKSGGSGGAAAPVED